MKDSTQKLILTKSLPLLGVLLLIAVATPAYAAYPPTAGARLNLLHACFSTGTLTTIGDTTYCTGATATLPAKSAFFVRHGIGTIEPTWRQNNPAERLAFSGPNTRFDLFVDGTLVHSIQFFAYSSQFDTMAKFFLTNFPNGMAGIHTFEGQFYVDSLYNGEPAGQSVLSLDIIAAVTFS